VTVAVAADPFFAIGDPGRAALEVPPGRPSARVGPADAELSAATLPGMVIQAASTRGILHRASGTVRQDAFALGHQTVSGEPEMAVAVVCDGVGSLDRSDEAAVLVSRRLTELGAAGVPWPDAFTRANDELTKVAGQDQAGGRPAMATTAVAVTVRQDGADWLGEVAWVGDSTLWHLSRRGEWSLLTVAGPDDGGDYYSAAVHPLPSRDGACDWCGFRVHGGALFLMTDGVANPLRWSDEVRLTLAGWWGRPPAPFTFAAQVGFARKTHMDDRTVVGIWPEGGGQECGSAGPVSDS
jgi:Protein phosphatase 2C